MVDTPFLFFPSYHSIVFQFNYQHRNIDQKFAYKTLTLKPIVYRMTLTAFIISSLTWNSGSIL